ncbi:NXPE2 [Branchiostoma lanceolatum]|uniref:NXPE2 protein n=1 Tax=Branchiostoma lanceolatum TaxID=7740 RepID=A0A8K0A020_BRALA|nr:NXPE2 [Branchiostoma lanceolatum]
MRGTSNAQMANLTWWQVLKRVLIGSVILTTGAEFLTTLMGKAEILSKQHDSVFTVEDLTTVPDLGTSPYPDMYMPRVEVTLAGVQKLLQAEPTHVYRSRMHEVRSAIKELHKKYPETTVIVKTCNTRHHRHYREVIQASDWLADQLNQEMRGILGDLNVAILDVWDMTVSQWYAQDLHPNVHVVDNELNILMSYICPWMITNIEG